MLGLRCCRDFLSWAPAGFSLVAVCGLLISEGSRWGAFASVVAARGIFLKQEANPCPLHWQAVSEPLGHQKSSSSFPFAILLLNTKELFFLRTMNCLLVGYSPNCWIRHELVTEHKQDWLYTKWNLGTSLVVQWLWLCELPLQGPPLQSLVWKQRSPHVAWFGQKKKILYRSTGTK